jgi:hypothetical protein
MPAKVREVSLDTRTARLKLVPRIKPYNRRLEAETRRPGVMLS